MSMTAVAGSAPHGARAHHERAPRPVPEQDPDPHRAGAHRGDLARADGRPPGDLVPAALATSRSTGWWESFLQFRYTLENYQQVLSAAGHARGVPQHAVIAVPSTLIPLVLASMAAYAFSWLQLPVPRRAVPDRRRAADDPGPGRVHPAAEAVRPDGPDSTATAPSGSPTRRSRCRSGSSCCATSSSRCRVT